MNKLVLLVAILSGCTTVPQNNALRFQDYSNSVNERTGFMDTPDNHYSQYLPKPEDRPRPPPPKKEYCAACMQSLINGLNEVYGNRPIVVEAPRRYTTTNCYSTFIGITCNTY